MLCQLGSLLRWIALLLLSLHTVFKSWSAEQELRKDWLCFLPDCHDLHLSGRDVHSQRLDRLVPKRNAWLSLLIRWPICVPRSFSNHQDEFLALLLPFVGLTYHPVKKLNSRCLPWRMLGHQVPLCHRSFHRYNVDKQRLYGWIHVAHKVGQHFLPDLPGFTHARCGL